MVSDRTAPRALLKITSILGMIEGSALVVMIQVSEFVYKLQLNQIVLGINLHADMKEIMHVGCNKDRSVND